nr:hypothetical protein Q903MT_gene2701 [Picea sitchensis]
MAKRLWVNGSSQLYLTLPGLDPFTIRLTIIPYLLPASLTYYLATGGVLSKHSIRI